MDDIRVFVFDVAEDVVCDDALQQTTRLCAERRGSYHTNMEAPLPYMDRRPLT